MDSINLKELAKQLNLSVSTVSKAFRNSYDINPETKERVLALAKQLNYQPNPYASGLRTQKSKTIAVVMPEIANNFFVQAINGIESVAQENGYHVLIYLTHEDPQQEIAILQHLQNGRVDAVLVSLSNGQENAHYLKELQQKGVPFVLFDRVNHEVEAIKVETNNQEASYEATKYLIDLGCSKIAHLTYEHNLSIRNQRLAGYQQALRNYGTHLSETILYCTHENAEALLEDLFLHDSSDAICCAFEKLALQTYQVCEKLKINIPDQVKIISFSNLEIADLLKPSLSTVVQPAFDMGKTAAETLFKLLRGLIIPAANQSICIPSSLIVRDSANAKRIR